MNLNLTIQKTNERNLTGKKRERAGRSPVTSKIIKIQLEDINIIQKQQQEQQVTKINEGAGTSGATNSTMSSGGNSVNSDINNSEVPQIKTNFTNVVQVKTSNRFAPLDQKKNDNNGNNSSEEGEIDSPTATTTKKTKPPPIVIHGIPTSHKDFIDELNQSIKKGYHVKYTARKTNVFIHDSGEYKKYLTALDNSGKEFHTFTEKEEKHHGFVLMGLPRDVSEMDIKTDIETNHELNVINVYKMKNTRRSMYLVIMEQKITVKHLTQNVRYVYNTKVTWERHRNSRGIIQCHRCQQFSHATSNCRAKPICLKCAGPHWTKDCNITEKNEDNQKLLRCANCSRNHTANSTECPVYITKIEQIERRKQAKTINTETYHQRYIAAPLPKTNAWSMGNPLLKNNSTQQTTQNITAPQDYAHGSKGNNNTHTQQQTNMLNLVSEFDELNKLINVDKMYGYVKELNNLLRQCQSELQKFITFNNFCNKYFNNQNTQQCPP